MAWQHGVFRRPVIIASGDAGLRSHCVLQMFGQVGHVLTVADFRHFDIPQFMRQRGILMVDEQQLVGERSQHQAYVSGHGWQSPVMVLSRAGLPDMETSPLLYMAVPLQPTTVKHCLQLVG